MKYYLKWGENSCLKMELEFLSCVYTTSLSASYANIILWVKGYLFIEFVRNDLLAILPMDTRNLALFTRVKSAFRKFAFSTRAVHQKEKIMPNSGLHEQHL